MVFVAVGGSADTRHDRRCYQRLAAARFHLTSRTWVAGMERIPCSDQRCNHPWSNATIAPSVGSCPGTDHSIVAPVCHSTFTLLEGRNLGEETSRRRRFERCSA